MMRKKQKSNGLNKNISNELLLVALPGIIWFIIFKYAPMVGAIIAFKDYKYNLGIIKSPWVGFKNFEFFFKSNDAARIIFNTLGYNILFIIASLFFAVILALLLYEVGKKVVKVSQTCLLLPQFISWVVVGYISLTLFDFESGIMNTIWSFFGKEPVSWYDSTGPWPIILIISNTWKGVGNTALIFYGTIIGIGSELFEAAELDGCTGLKKVMKITIPLLKPTIVTMLILNIGNAMRGDFGLFYYTTNDSKLLYPVTDVIDTYTFRALRVNGDVAASSAVSLFQSVVGMIMVIATNWIAKKVEPGTEMF